MKRRRALSLFSGISLSLLLTTSIAMAHPGHNHGDDGRIPGQPDFQQIGPVEVRFHPKKRSYSYERPNQPLLWFHRDEFPAEHAGGYALPPGVESVVCATSGHRIKILYAAPTSRATPTAEELEAIRNYVRRANWKILSQSGISSGYTRALKMRVDCNASGEINIWPFVVAVGNPSQVFARAEEVYGYPSGAESVKNLIFYNGVDSSENPAAGYGQMANDSIKSSSDSANGNRARTSSAVVYRPTQAPGVWEYWSTHAVLHELFHTMGAVNSNAPFGTDGNHCTDGLDVMCYEDGTGSEPYSTSRCSSSAGYGGAIAAPLDCMYDSYFDAAEESGEWLNTHWNTGGSENPFLVEAPTPATPEVETLPASGVTKTDAVLNGSIKPSGLTSQYHFEYGVSTSYGTNVPAPDLKLESNLYQAQTVTRAITGLQPATTYHYRLVASNAKGTSYGPDRTFTTPVWWSIQPTPNASGAEHSTLYDMSCSPSSTSQCTAVGQQRTSSGTSSPYAQFWNGSAWSNLSAATPTGATAAELQANHCVSGFSCVAAGSYTSSLGTFSLVEAWTGGSWTIQPTPNPPGATATQLKGISCKELTACIAVGYSGSGSASSPVAMNGKSGSWSLQTVPIPAGAVGAELTGVDCTSTTSCRAVGRYYPTTSSTTYWAMVSTWNGLTWSSEAVPKPPAEPKRSTLLDISCSSGSACTAVGGYLNSSGTQVSYVARWNGLSWSWQSSPNPTGSTNTPLQNISCVASSPCVAVGDWRDASGVWRPMAQFWDGTSWVIESVEVPSGLSFGVFEGVACRSRCLTVGWYTASGQDKTLGEIR